jgi:hypothetical protein
VLILPLLFFLHVSGYDLIFGIDWLSHNSPMNINWKTDVIKLLLQGKKVTLHSQLVSIDINMTEPIVNISKEQNNGSQIFLANLFCVQEQSKADTADLLSQVQSILSNFSSIFAEPSSLPPSRTCDHRKNLLPNSQPSNLRP